MFQRKAREVESNESIHNPETKVPKVRRNGIYHREEEGEVRGEHRDALPVLWREWVSLTKDCKHHRLIEKLQGVQPPFVAGKEYFCTQCGRWVRFERLPEARKICERCKQPFDKLYATRNGWLCDGCSRR